MNEDRGRQAHAGLSAATTVVSLVVVGLLVLGGLVVVSFVRGPGPSPAVLAAVSLWVLTAALAAAAVVAVREWLRGDLPPTGRGHLLAVRVVVVAATLVAGAAASWVTLDRATNRSATEIEQLLAAVGDDLVADTDAAPTIDDVRRALTDRVEGRSDAEAAEQEEATEPTDDEPDDPPGLRVLPAGGSVDAVDYQVTDDDGGSPQCLRFEPDTTTDVSGVDVVEGYRPVVVEGLC